MQLEQHLSIQDWIKLHQQNPAHALLKFEENLNSIPENERKLALSWIPPAKTLWKAFNQPNNGAKFSGVPYLLKDLYDVMGCPTHCSSTFLSELRSDPENSCFLYKKMDALGGIFCGKTHMNEFAYGLDGHNLHYGNCPHPQFRNRLSGGSSSGSAWAVGKGLVPLAFCTDTGGSIRVPAAFCGIFGYRTMPNRWVQEGGFPLAPTLDTAGWFTRTASDMAYTLSHLLEVNAQKETFRGFYLAMKKNPILPEFREAYDKFAHTFDLEVEGPHHDILEEVLKDSVETYSILQSLEAYNVHESWLDSHRDRYDPLVWQRIERARHWTEKQINLAIFRQDMIRDAIAELLVLFDAIVMPVVHHPTVGYENFDADFRHQLLTLNTPGSIARLPILTIPVKLKSGLSGGLQVIVKSPQSPVPMMILKELAKSIYT